MIARRDAMTLALVLATAGLGTPKAKALEMVPRVIDPHGPALAWGKGVGDIDGDGRPDLVVGGYDARHGGLYWYRNPGWQRQAIDGRARVGTDLEVIDLDRDGRRDVVAITATGGRHGLTWFQRARTGWTSRQLANGVALHDVEVVDLDRDGRPDLAGRAQAGAGDLIHIWRQVTPGQWVASRLTVPGGGEGLLAVDLNRDRKPDLAVGKYWYANASRPGRIAFVRHTYNAGAPRNAYVAAGDLDGDGRIDLVTAPAERAGQHYRVAWFQAPANPTGLWVERVLENGVECVVHFAGVADFTGDRRPDVATAMMQQGHDPKIKLYENRGGGRFGAARIVARASSHSMKILDVGGRKSLLGADWRMSPRTPVKLFRPR